VFGQGQLNFTTRVTGGVLNAPVYLPETSDSRIEQHGQSAIGIPTGTVVYTGGVIPSTSGSAYSAQIFAGALGTTDENLAGLTPITTFRTATTAGQAGNVIAVNMVVPNVASGSAARLQVRAWQNLGGTITSWSAALAQANAAPATYQYGDGLSFDSIALTAAPNPPADSVGTTSFNLHTLPVPEPSTIALGVLGLGALVLFRRRK